MFPSFYCHENAVLPTNNQVPIENVVVAESGDESEDEWNYIKVDKEKPEQDNKSEDRETPNIELESEHDKEQSKQAAEEDITSPTPPTASLGETDFVNQQSHAIAQAFAQPEEACSEVSVTRAICVCVSRLITYISACLKKKSKLSSN